VLRHALPPGSEPTPWVRSFGLVDTAGGRCIVWSYRIAYVMMCIRRTRCKDSLRALPRRPWRWGADESPNLHGRVIVVMLVVDGGVGGHLATRPSTRLKDLRGSPVAHGAAQAIFSGWIPGGRSRRQCSSLLFGCLRISTSLSTASTQRLNSPGSGIGRTYFAPVWMAGHRRSHLDSGRGGRVLMWKCSSRARGQAARSTGAACVFQVANSILQARRIF
jgi:hypothetical protein